VTGNGPEVTASGNTLTVADFGSTKTMPYTYELKFTAKAAGTAAVTLKSAAFGTRESAVSQDVTAAALNGDSVTTVIGKKTHAVTLPSFFTGNSVANDGEAYTFHPVDSNPAHYSYTEVAATVNGTAVAVTDNSDGSYTVNNVTGPLTVTAVQTPKSYSVTFQTDTGVELPANGTAAYGTDYTFTMPQRDHYATSIQSAMINGTAIPYTISETGHVAIDGARVEGDIVIVIQQVQTESPVSVIGSGAGDAAGYTLYATVGSSYTLTLAQDVKYDYTVTATIAGQPVTLLTEDSRYTIQNVTAGEIVFTVNRSLKTQGMSAGLYLNLNGTSVWLVKNAVDRLEDSTYTYDRTQMYWSGAYNAYCCLVISTAAPAITADRLAIAGGAAQEVSYSGDVNLTGTVDANDAQLVYNLYNVSYNDFSIVSMEKYLRADVNGSGNVDINDAAAVIAAILEH
ncbi:MAG: dockerin type I domain-containing protein, partial [Clostridiaceae bacterium]|nr:dockerin type I domain-containing protein [Clostridiaceae bacterium]